ncbi:MAG: thioredoxin fold domain-containing protein [Armatimonadota bacterium]|nr:thioredoxin fold domain-containing protein [Armatimonadota bacterium]MDR5702297.1 thioredoxin fold domain-containing protein [Armatimonadota bacterium]
MKGTLRVLTAVVGLVLTSEAVAGSARIVWRKWTEGVGLGRQVRRPLLVYFHKPACPYCERMDAVTFSDAAIQKVVQRCFVPVRVESFNPAPFAGPGGERVSGVQLRDRYRVVTFPTIVVLDYRDLEKEYMRIPGYVGPKDFMELLAYITRGWYGEMSFDLYLEHLLNKTLPTRAATAPC